METKYIHTYIYMQVQKYTRNIAFVLISKTAIKYEYIVLKYVCNLSVQGLF